MKRKTLRKLALMAAAALLLVLLPACGCDPGGEVVFVQTGGEKVVSVLVEGHLGGGGAQNADCSPLKVGASLSFQSKDVGWPMTVTACGGEHGAEPIASVVIPEAPAKGERWFVYFQNGALEYGPAWPEEG